MRRPRRARATAGYGRSDDGVWQIPGSAGPRLAPGESA